MTSAARRVTPCSAAAGRSARGHPARAAAAAAAAAGCSGGQVAAELTTAHSCTSGATTRCGRCVCLIHEMAKLPVCLRGGGPAASACVERDARLACERCPEQLAEAPRRCGGCTCSHPVALLISYHSLRSRRPQSVLGIGAYARDRGARLACVDEAGMEEWLASPPPAAGGRGATGGGNGGSSGGREVAYSLAAYPSMDNFEGRLHPLEWVEKASARPRRSQQGWVAALPARGVWWAGYRPQARRGAKRCMRSAPRWPRPHAPAVPLPPATTGPADPRALHAWPPLAGRARRRGARANAPTRPVRSRAGFCSDIFLQNLWVSHR